MRAFKVFLDIIGLLSVLVVAWGVKLLADGRPAPVAGGVIGAGLGGVIWGFGLSALVGAVARIEKKVDALAELAAKVDLVKARLEETVGAEGYIAKLLATRAAPPQ